MLWNVLQAGFVDAMKILMLSPECPMPANTGALVRIYQIWKGLNRKHSITLAAPNTAIKDFNYLESMTDFEGEFVCLPKTVQDLRRKVLAVLSPYPYHVPMNCNNGIKHEVARLLNQGNYSLIYIHFIHALAYIPFNTHLPIVLDQHNVDREYWRMRIQFAGSLPSKIFAFQNLYKTIVYEDGWLKRLCGIVSVSEKDQKQTRNYTKHFVKNFFLAPNGVDIEHYRQKIYLDRQKKITLGFMGSMDMEINQNAALVLCQKILPILRTRNPNYEISAILIGRNPPSSIVALSRKDPLIKVTGTVNDVYPYLKQLDIFVGPLKGGAGTKLRVFEAMSVGLPLVGSPYLFDGIQGLIDRANVFIVDDDIDSYCRRIENLMYDAELRVQMGNKLRQLCECNYSWGKITSKLADDLGQIIPAPRHVLV
jgi:glycosyltransferase involved in cell wall biosynthesis